MIVYLTILQIEKPEGVPEKKGQGQEGQKGNQGSAEGQDGAPVKSKAQLKAERRAIQVC